MPEIWLCLFLTIESVGLSLVAGTKQCSTNNQIIPSKNLVKFGVLLPFQGNYPWVIRAVFPAIQLATESPRVTLEILPGYKFEINTADSGCSDTIGPLAAIDMYINQSAHVFLGPACEYAIAPVARFSYYWGIPILTAGAMVVAFSDKNEYKLLTRVQGPLVKGSEFILHLFTMFHWKHMAIVFGDIKGPNSGKRNCYFSAEAVYQFYSKTFKRSPYYADFDEKVDKMKYDQILKDCSKRARSE